MTAVESGRTGAHPESVDGSNSRWRAYLALTKPRVIELLLVTTIPVMFLAAEGFPPLSTTLLTLLGGTMAAAGANVINQVYDRDIDAVMVRTQQRPLVT
ncbi:MAG TPA: UbiA family prenyltransferase, partial [Candidatus Limnocylindrales bacterium]|nr:UbiA family prenyltransferase [Candidatus Limnocylindrales bacterium]